MTPYLVNREPLSKLCASK